MDFNKRCISKEEFKKHEDSDVAYALYVRDNLKPNDYYCSSISITDARDMEICND